MERYKKYLFFGLCGITALSFARYVDSAGNWITDIFSHFILQYAIIAFVLMIICLRNKYYSMAVLSVLLFIFNVSATIDYGETIHAFERTERPLKVYSANIYIDNDNLSKLNRELEEINPDIILLEEVVPENIKRLQPVIKTYPYHEKIIFSGERKVGFVFLSKFPVLNTHVTQLSEWGNFILEAMLDINQSPIMFYGVHAQRPHLRNYTERKNQLLWLARQIREKRLPVIVAGDFNSSPYSPIFRDVVRTAGLKDTREGFGWLPSWPTYFPPIWIPIDHILVSPDIQVLKRTTGSYFGSDHYPVIAELSLG